MANTFKVVTKAGVTSEDVIYTVASSTTTVILGLVLGLSLIHISEPTRPY